MVKDNNDLWISKDPKTNLLCLRFRCREVFGGKQQYIAYGLEDNEENRNLVRTKRDQIKSDLKFGCLDPTLDKYRLNPRSPKPTTPKVQLGLRAIWSQYVDFKKHTIEKTTLIGVYGSITRWIESLPTDDVFESVKIRNFLLENTTLNRAYFILEHLNSACDLIANTGGLDSNPISFVRLKRPKRDEVVRSFTLEQRNLIIDKFYNHTKHSHYANLVSFLFLTGCRSGEAFGLLWGNISRDNLRITFKFSCNGYRVSKGTKNGVIRVFSTKSGSRLNHLLNSMVRGDDGDLVFSTKKYTPIITETFRPVWYGQFSTLKDGQKKFYPGVITELVDSGELPHYLNQYATRHTFATHAIANGITPEKVAKLLGDKIETVLKYYVHPHAVDFDCPDF